MSLETNTVSISPPPHPIFFYISPNWELVKTKFHAGQRPVTSTLLTFYRETTK